MSYSDQEDPYCTDDAASIVSVDSEYAVKLRHNAKDFLSDGLWEEDRMLATWERDQEELHNSLHLCNLNYPQKILDIGCGRGDWAIAIADEYPSALVIGLDVNNYLPKFIPTNLQLQLADYHFDLTFESDSFDLIHISHLDGCVRDWDVLFRNVYRILKRGGHIECLEESLTIKHGQHEKGRNVDYLLRFVDELLRASGNRGTPLNVAPQLSSHLKKAGFVIKSLTQKPLFIRHHKDLERRRFNAFAQGLLDGAPDLVILTTALAVGELKDDDYMTLYWVCAQKPYTDFH